MRSSLCEGRSDNVRAVLKAGRNAVETVVSVTEERRYGAEGLYLCSQSGVVGGEEAMDMGVEARRCDSRLWYKFAVCEV